MTLRLVFTAVGTWTLVGIPIARDILKKYGGSHEGFIVPGWARYAVGLVLLGLGSCGTLGWDREKRIHSMTSKCTEVEA